MPAKARARLCLRALRALWMEGDTERLERRAERLRVHVGAGFEAEDTEVDGSEPDALEDTGEDTLLKLSS